MGKKRKMPGLNTSSTADISFMLLIFFLVTTSMDTDQGLARTLPKPPEDDQLNNEIKVKERNILNIRINKDNYLLIGDDYATLADVKERAKEFIKNEDNRPNLPELKPKKIKGLGNKTMMVTENHVISVQTDRGTDYGVYFAVQDALVSAYNELRDELAKEEFGYKYESLTADQGREMPEMNTSSLPDLIFTILFFFMMVTTMREVTLQVRFEKPVGTQLEKLARKSSTSFIYIGQPTDQLKGQYGSAHRIQLNDKIVEAPQVYDFVMEERGELAEADKPFYTVSIKADHHTPMGIITDVKQVLRKAYALKMMYSANKQQ